MSRKSASIFAVIVSFFVFSVPFFNVYAYTTNMDASIVIGHDNMSSGSANGGQGSVGNYGFDTPYDVATDGHKFIIADYNNNRVLIYNSVPTSSNPIADVVVGQTSMSGHDSNQGGPAGANTMSLPTGVAIIQDKLYVADYGNNRVLIYNTIPTSDNASADIVIGQTDTSSTGAATTQGGLNSPEQISYDSDSNIFAVADNGNHRILLWHGVPTSTGQGADVVVGQGDFSTAAHPSPPDATSLESPYAAVVTHGKLVVADTGNHRVLVYNSVPTSAGASADVVIGQSSMAGESANQGGSVSANTLKTPTSVDYDGRRFYIEDSGNARVLVYDGIPTTSDPGAAIVIGQSDMSGGSSNQGGSVGPTTLSSGDGALQVYNNVLYVADNLNHRVLAYNNVSQARATPATSTTDTTATITWDTDQPTAEYVEYGSNTSAYGLGRGTLFNNGAGRLLTHSITLSNLQACTRYHVRVTDVGYDLIDHVSDDVQITTSGTCTGFATSWDTPEGNHVDFGIAMPNNIYTTDSHPAFRFTEATDTEHGISRYQVVVKGPESQWETYVDDIRPADQRGTDSFLVQGDDRVVKYDVAGRAIEVNRTDSDHALKPGAYKYKIRAVNSLGGTIETSEQTLRINTYSAVFSDSSLYFPIVLQQIGERKKLIMSAMDPASVAPFTKIKPFAISTRKPTFYGITNSAAHVRLILMKYNTDDTTEYTEYTTDANDASRFGINVTEALKPGTYEVRLSATNDSSDYMEMPSFVMKVR